MRKDFLHFFHHKLFLGLFKPNSVPTCLDSMLSSTLYCSVVSSCCQCWFPVLFLFLFSSLCRYLIPCSVLFSFHLISLSMSHLIIVISVGCQYPVCSDSMLCSHCCTLHLIVEVSSMSCWFPLLFSFRLCQQPMDQDQQE